MNRQKELETIKSKIRILDLARDAGVQLVPCGPDKWRCRSLTNITESRPSLVIYASQNTYYDYSSATGGSVIDYYMALYRVDYITAVRELRRLAGLEDSVSIQRKPHDAIRAREAMYQIMTIAYHLDPELRHKILRDLAEQLESMAVHVKDLFDSGQMIG